MPHSRRFVDLLLIHMKLPAFRDFDNFGLNSVHCRLQFCQVRSSAHRFGEALFQLSLWLFIALLAQVTLSSDLITLLSSLLQAKETCVSLHCSLFGLTLTISLLCASTMALSSMDVSATAIPPARTLATLRAHSARHRSFPWPHHPNFGGIPHQRMPDPFR